MPTKRERDSDTKYLMRIVMVVVITFLESDGTYGSNPNPKRETFVKVATTGTSTIGESSERI